MAQNIIDPLKQNEKLGASMTSGASPVQTVTPPTSSPVGISSSVKPETSGIGGVASQNAGSIGQDTLTGDFSGLNGANTLRSRNATKEPGGFASGMEPLPTPKPIGSPALPETKPMTANDIPTSGGKVDTSKLSPEQSAYYNANRTLIDANAAKVAMEQELSKQAEEAALGAEQKFAKDVGQAQSDTQKAYDLAKKTAEIQNAAQLQSAKDSLDKLNRNIRYFSGAAGFPQTEQGMKAQHEQLLRATDLVNRIQQLGDLQAQGMSDELANKMRELQEALDSNVSRAVQEALVNVGTLKSMGKLDSVEAINKARSDLRDTLNTKYNDFLKNTFEMSKLAYEKAEKGLEAYQKSKEFSAEFTKTKNDDFIYAANGQPMTDSLGQPIRRNKNKVLTDKIDNKDGSVTLIYDDNTIERIKAGEDTSKKIDESVTKMLGATTGFVYNSQGNIITGSDGQPLKYQPEAKSGQVIKIEDEFGNERVFIFDGQNLKPYNIPSAPSAGTPGTGEPRKYVPGQTDFTSLASKYPNVAAFKNNNPAGITWNANFDNNAGTAKALADAGISFEKGTARPASEGGNYVKFGSMEDGLAAQRIIMERTYGGATVGKMLASWVGTSEGPQYAESVSASAGVDPNAQVASLSPQQLDALQIAKLKRESPGLSKELESAGIIEGNVINFPQQGMETAETSPTVASFTESLKSGNFSIDRKPERKYSATDIALFDKFLSSKDTESDKKELRRRGYKTEDVDAYAASIPPSTELSEKKFTQYNQVVSRFSADPGVKAFEEAMRAGGDLITSLESASGPGDISAVFQFMKSLDPTSTVREGEFALAAKSAGVWEQFKNIPANKIEGTVLTPEQRKSFGKLAMKFIENKAKTYDTKYSDMKRVLDSQGIPDTYLPTKMSDFIKEYSTKEGGDALKAKYGY